MPHDTVRVQVPVKIIQAVVALEKPEHSDTEIPKATTVPTALPTIAPVGEEDLEVVMCRAGLQRAQV